MFNEPFPKIQAEDWILRIYSLNDLELIRGASKDTIIPLITSIPSNFSKTAGEEFIKRQWSRFDNKIGYAFVIAQKSDNEAIGAIYLGLENITEGRASIGYWLLRSKRGKNIAAIALKKPSSMGATKSSNPSFRVICRTLESSVH